jgi:hypothetical protein
MRIVFALSLALAATSPVTAQEPEAPPGPAQVLPIGTFHFKDAGLDLAKVDDFDVMGDEAQAYLVQLTRRLAEFRPTAVLLEYDPASDAEMNQRYTDYLAGQYELPANETYQLGFRVARLAGLERVHSWDHRDVPWQAEALFEYGAANASPEVKELQDGIAAFMQEEAEVRAKSTLADMLRRHNDPHMERLNMDLYLLTNPVGAGDGWAGANATASWWRRNFRMYANIQQQAVPGARVIVIGGSGHMAIIKQLLNIDTRIESVDPLTLF